MKIDLIAASVKRVSVKCQKNGFDSLTVANGRTRLKKQAPQAQSAMLSKKQKRVLRA